MKYLQTFVIGCIAVLAISLTPHISTSTWASVFAAVLVVVVVWGAKKVANHFCFEHTHAGDSEVDTSIGATLVAVNILHPLVDGIALYGTYRSGNTYLFISLLVGIVVHEIFRQSALVIVFRQFGFMAWKVIVPAIAGMGFGWFLGGLGGELPAGLEPYIDALTFGAYTFIVAEYVFAHKEIVKKRTSVFALIAGIVIAVIFTIFFEVH